MRLAEVGVTVKCEQGILAFYIMPSYNYIVLKCHEWALCLVICMQDTQVWSYTV